MNKLARAEVGVGVGGRVVAVEVERPRVGAVAIVAADIEGPDPGVIIAIIRDAGAKKPGRIA